ncbi:MAG: DUF892 family protein [Thermoleophilia bacterium]|nr:DUF892 family protein [Thermoleophilia bacterium]
MEGRAKEQLERHLREAHALEESVLRMLNSLAKTAPPAVRRLAAEHEQTTREHVERLRRRLEQYGSAPSRTRQLARTVMARAKSVLELARREREARQVRDAFVSEQTEVAAYELLERVATRAGDEETATLARRNRAEDEAMAQRIAAHWDEVAERSLASGDDDDASSEVVERVGDRAKQAARTASSLARNPIVLGASSLVAGLVLRRRARRREEGGDEDGSPAAREETAGHADSETPAETVAH